MNAYKLFILSCIAMSCALWPLTGYTEPPESKNLHTSAATAKSLTLKGDTSVLCWYGEHPQLGTGLYCFLKPHDNMQFLDTSIREPPAKKSSPSLIPSSSIQSVNQNHPPLSILF